MVREEKREGLIPPPIPLRDMAVVFGGITEEDKATHVHI